MGAHLKTRFAAHCVRTTAPACCLRIVFGGTVAFALRPHRLALFFADDQGLRKLQAALKLTPGSKGENVIVTVPKDLGLLDDTVEPAPGAVCSRARFKPTLISPLPASVAPRPPDHLRQERLSWPK